MKKQFIIFCLALLASASAISAQSSLMRVEVNGKIGFGYPDPYKKDNNGYPVAGALIIPAIYDETTGFAETTEGLAGVKKGGKWGFIDAHGATKIPFKYDDASYFNEGLAYVKQNGKYGFINKTGAMVIPLKYENAFNFDGGLAYVELGGKVGFVDKTGKLVIPAKYDVPASGQTSKCNRLLYVFYDGIATVLLDGKCGTIDSKGNFTPSN